MLRMNAVEKNLLKENTDWIGRLMRKSSINVCSVGVEVLASVRMNTKSRLA